MKLERETKKLFGLFSLLGGSLIWLCVIFGVILPLSMPWWFYPTWWQTVLVSAVSFIPLMVIMLGGGLLYLRNSD